MLLHADLDRLSGPAMLIDGPDLAGRVVEADVCIVGAGPAGLSLALELDSQRVSVCLLESGGLTRGAPPDLLTGTTDSPLHPQDHLLASRGSGLGGTANMWEVDLGGVEPFVRYAVPDEIDFEPRAPLREAAWPFSLRSLDPLLRRAAGLCGIPEDSFERHEHGSTPLPLPEEDLQTKLFAFGPAAVFAHDARGRLESSTTTTVALQSTAVELQLTSDGGRVASVLVATGGRTFRVSSRFVVLASGALENARLLLLSQGLANEHELVGRFLTDHPFVEVGLVAPANRQVFEQSALYDVRETDGSYAMGYLAPALGALEAESLLNAAIFLFPRPPAYGSPGVAALRELSARRGADLASLRHAARAAIGIRDVLSWAYQRRLPGNATDGHAGGWSTRPDLAKRFALFRLEAQLEQAPDADNRVTLSSSVDSLGRPQLDLRWRWGEADIESFERLQSFLGRVVSASGFGAFRPTGGIRGAFSPHHAMGTTRMHEHPEQGVVDANCRVHGTENLFVAGSSVFPNAAGSANPTLLIVALAIRLAERLLTLL